MPEPLAQHVLMFWSDGLRPQSFSGHRTGTAIRAAHGAGHGYHRDRAEMMTGFAGAGAGVRAGVVPLLPLKYVAPFIAVLLDVRLPGRRRCFAPRPAGFTDRNKHDAPS